MEKEVDGTLNYLDLAITRDNVQLKYAVYHKSTAIDTSIHATSYQHPATKVTPFIYYIDRLLSIYYRI